MVDAAPMALMTIEVQNGDPSLEAAAEQLGVTVADIDASFGIVSLDVERKLFAVRVRADKLKHDESRAGVGGPYSNPDIEPFGPPRSSR